MLHDDEPIGCPDLDRELEALHADPMTAYSGCGDEVHDLIVRKHVASCARCRRERGGLGRPAARPVPFHR